MVITGYLISVNIYKLINGMSSITDIENIGKIITYMIIFGLASYTVRVIDQPQCAYDDGLATDPVFKNLKNISIFGIVASVLSTGYSLYNMFVKPNKKVRNVEKVFLNDIVSDITGKKF
jgi:hypothetical protein